MELGSRARPQWARGHREGKFSEIVRTIACCEYVSRLVNSTETSRVEFISMRSAPYFLSSSEVLLRLATGTAPQGEKLAEVPSCPGGSPMEEDPRTQLGTLSLRSQRGSFQQNLIKRRSWGGKRRLSMGQGRWLWQCSGECCPVGEGGSPPAALLWALGVAFWKGSCTCRQEEQGLR